MAVFKLGFLGAGDFLLRDDLPIRPHDPPCPLLLAGYLRPARNRRLLPCHLHRSRVDHRYRLPELPTRQKAQTGGREGKFEADRKIHLLQAPQELPNLGLGLHLDR